MTSATERLLRETLRAPEHRVGAGVGLLDRARLEGARRRRCRRATSVTLSVTSMVAIIGTGAVFSPHLFGKHYVGQPGSGGLRVVSTPPLPLPQNQTTLWSEQAGARTVDVVASWSGGRLCLHRWPAAAAPRCTSGTAVGWLLAGPVGGPSGVTQGDAPVSHYIVAGSRLLTGVDATLSDGDVISGYESDLPTGVRLFDIVVPHGIRVTGLKGNYAGAEIDSKLVSGR